MPPSPKVANAATDAVTSTAVAIFFFRKLLNIVDVRFIGGAKIHKVLTFSQAIHHFISPIERITMQNVISGALFFHKRINLLQENTE